MITANDTMPNGKPRFQIDASPWMHARWSASVWDRKARIFQASCTHQHRTRAAALTCGKRLLRRTVKNLNAALGGKETR